MEIYDAIASGDTALVKELLSSKNPSLRVNDNFSNGLTPLIYAINNHQLNMVKLLLSLGADVNKSCEKRKASYDGKQSVCPLQAAVESKNPEMIMLLLKHGAFSTDISVHSLLHYSVKWNAVDLVSYLITQALDNDMYVVKAQFDASQHLLTAVQDNNIKMVNVLLQHGVSPNHPHGDMVPIVMAANNGNMRICQALVNFGAQINKRTGATLGEANTPLGRAICAGMYQAVKRLLLLGADPKSTIDWSMPVGDITLNPGSTMLHLAAAKNQKDIMDMLLHAGADVGAVDNSGESVLHLLCRDKSQSAFELLTFLLQCYAQINRYKIDINCKTNHGMTPLMVAAENKNIKAGTLLLSFGADLSCRNRKLYTALFFAVESSCEEFVKELIKAGSSVHGICGGLTPIHLAVRNGDIPITKLLLQHGADINSLAREGGDLNVAKGMSALHMAVLSHCEEMIKLCIDFGLPSNTQSSLGETPLMLAARQSGPSVITLLLENGANMNIRNHKQKETALSLAVYFGFEENAEILIRYGADVNMPDKRKVPPMHWAVYNNRVKTLQLLILADATFDRRILYSFPKNLSLMRNQKLFQWLQEQTKCLKSLQRFCRGCIRSALKTKAQGKSIKDMVDVLPLPAKLKDYLLLLKDDIIIFEESGSLEE